MSQDVRTMYKLNMNVSHRQIYPKNENCIIGNVYAQHIILHIFNIIRSQTATLDFILKMR